MAIHSSLAKGVRKTGENIKSQITKSSIKKGNYQKDDDSEATSSMNGSTSSATSSNDIYKSGMEEGIRRKKTLAKSNSKKVNGFGSFRLSRRTPKSSLTSLADDGSATTLQPSPARVSNPSPNDHFQKSAQKFTRSGSLRSLKILRNKNRLPSESNKSPNVKDLHSKKSTFSSILKDSKFHKPEEPPAGVKEAEELLLSVAKHCPYQHCSLRGDHNHHNEPPLERFAYLKRRSSNDQKSLNPQTRTTDKQSGKKPEVKVTKKVSNKGRKNEGVDFSIELYAKTRSEPIFEERFGCDDVDLADFMFGIGGGNQDRGVKAIPGSNIEGNSDNFAHFEVKNPAFNNRNETQRMFVIKMVREAIKKILVKEVISEHESSEMNRNEGRGISVPVTRTDQNKPGSGDVDLFGSKIEKLIGWSHIKESIVVKRFIREVEKAKEFEKHMGLVSKPEAENVSLRNQRIGEKKKSDEWMLDYALRQVLSELAPTQKRKVALLVEAFESVAPRLNDDCPPKESSLNNPNLERVGPGVNGSGDQTKSENR